MCSVKMTHIRPIFGLKTAKTSQRDNDFSHNDTIIFDKQISFLRREPQIFIQRHRKARVRRGAMATRRAEQAAEKTCGNERKEEIERGNFRANGVFACQKSINNI